jgi:hypothetical protein
VAGLDLGRLRLAVRHGVGDYRAARPQPERAGELVWSHLKRSLANLAKRNVSQLTALVKTRLKRMQYRPGLLDGFLASTGLDLAPSSKPKIEDR